MNIMMRKIAMLEKDMLKKEEEARINGYISSPIDKNLKDRVSFLMDKMRTL